MKYPLWCLSSVPIMKVMGDAAVHQAIPQNTKQNAWRRTIGIENLPIDWKERGIDIQVVKDLASYLDCIEQKLGASSPPDECLSDNIKARAKDLETVFDTLYWLPDIEPEVFYQLEKYKPKDCSAAYVTCTASTPGEICPPWRFVVPEPAPKDAAGEHQQESSDVATISTDTPLALETHARKVAATVTAPSAPTSDIASINTENPFTWPTYTRTFDVSITPEPALFGDIASNSTEKPHTCATYTRTLNVTITLAPALSSTDIASNSIEKPPAWTTYTRISNVTITPIPAPSSTDTASNSTEKSPTWTTYTRTFDVTIPAAPAPNSDSLSSSSELPTNTTASGLSSATTIHSEFVSQFTSENGAGLVRPGCFHGMLEVVIPVAACLFVAALW